MHPSMPEGERIFADGTGGGQTGSEPRMMGVTTAMFIVRWDGGAPTDKGEWIEILRETLAAELGSYRVVFHPGPVGWRFALEWREDDQVDDQGLVANSPDSVAFNILSGLLDAGKPIEPGWTPSAGEPA